MNTPAHPMQSAIHQTGETAMSDLSWDISDKEMTSQTAEAPPPRKPSAARPRNRSAIPPSLPTLNASLPGFLRGLGAVVVVVAISALLFQNWGKADDLQRYLLLLAHTVGLGLGGFAIGHWLHEGKGARTLVMLAVASIPVNFTILGALLFGQLGGGEAVADIPQLALWRLGDPSLIFLTVAGSGLVLTLLSMVGFRVLARRSMLGLTGLYLLLNIGLLVPSRDSGLVSVLLVAMLMLSCQGIRIIRAGDATLATPEGWIARLVQFIPVTIVLGRQLWLYQADTFMLVAMSGAVFLVLRFIGQRLEDQPSWRRGLEMLSLLPALGVATGLTVLVGEESLYSLTLSLPFALLCVEISLRSAEDGPVYRRLAAAALALGGLLGLLVIGDTVNSLIALVLGLSVMVYAYASHQTLLFFLGVITFLGGLMLQLGRIGALVDFSHWGILAAIGVLAIVVGSVIERHGSQLRQRMETWRQGLGDWNG